MYPPIPYLDQAGYQLRTKFPRADVQLLAQNEPGYIETQIAGISSEINARLQKRYVVPLGQVAPMLLASGSSPPAVSLGGRPAVGSLEMFLAIDGAGPVGTATFKWSQDGGRTFVATGVLTGSSVALPGTGMNAQFGVGTYATDNVYLGSTPVPEIALRWCAAILDVDVWDKRGTNAQDPAIERAIARADRADAQMKEAANSETGLFDLPTNDEAGDSTIKHGGPLSYAEASPYVGADRQERQGICEDARGSGTYS